MVTRNSNSLIPLLALSAGLIVVTLIPYWQTTGYGFLQFDDDLYVTENPYVLNGLSWEGVKWAFSFGNFAMYQPLTFLSHMLDVELYGGTDADGGGHHVTNLALHIAATLVLFFTFVRMTDQIGASAFVAAVFAVHPMHVESVAWIAERKDVLSGFFWFLTIAAYAAYVSKPSAARYVAVALALIAGLLAKPMLVTLPFVLVLLDVWPLKRITIDSLQPKAIFTRLRPILFEKIPLFAIIFISSLVAFLAQRSQGAVADTQLVPLWARFTNACIAYGVYVAKLMWPVNMAPFYPHPGVEVSVPLALFAAIVLAAITVFALWKLRDHPFLAVGWFWFAGTLVPVIGIVQIGSQAYADRYSYIPHVGLLIMIAWGALALAQRWRIPTPAVAAAGAAAAVIFTALTYSQAAYWRDDLTLWAHTLDVTEDNNIAHNHYGIALSNEENHREAMQHFVRALEINPNHVRARVGLAGALFDLGHLDQAIETYRQALTLKPDHVPAHLNLGMALVRARQPEQGEYHLQEAVRLDPTSAFAHNNLGVALSVQGKFDEALPHFARALELKPGYANAQQNLQRAQRELARRQ